MKGLKNQLDLHYTQWLCPILRADSLEKFNWTESAVTAWEARQIRQAPPMQSSFLPNSDGNQWFLHSRWLWGKSSVQFFSKRGGAGWTYTSRQSSIATQIWHRPSVSILSQHSQNEVCPSSQTENNLWLCVFLMQKMSQKWETRKKILLHQLSSDSKFKSILDKQGHSLSCFNRLSIAAYGPVWYSTLCPVVT